MQMGFERELDRMIYTFGHLSIILSIQTIVRYKEGEENLKISEWSLKDTSIFNIKRLSDRFNMHGEIDHLTPWQVYGIIDSRADDRSCLSNLAPVWWG